MCARRVGWNLNLGGPAPSLGACGLGGRVLRCARLPLVVALVFLGALGCGRSEAGEPPPDAVAQGGASPGRTAARVQVHPTTEEGLVEAVARAISARDIDALAALSTPEQAADLRILHERDPEGFWRRGERWVKNVESGLTIAQRSDPKQPRWRALVRFGNGAEETVVFTRVGGKLYFEQL